MTHGFPNQVPHLAWCEVHEKKAFTKANAKKLIRMLRARSDTGMREYPCGWIDSGFHVGHLPPAVLRGKMTAREVYGPPEAA